MKDDLNKAEEKWAQRRLFAPAPRRRGRWLWLLLLLGVLLYWLLYWVVEWQVIDARIADGINLPLF